MLLLAFKCFEIYQAIGSEKARSGRSACTNVVARFPCLRNACYGLTHARNRVTVLSGQCRRFLDPRINI
jgi:hypothetical protein